MNSHQQLAKLSPDSTIAKVAELLKKRENPEDDNDEEEEDPFKKPATNN